MKKNILVISLVAALVMIVAGCETMSKIIRVSEVPALNYEKIIYLRTWSPSALDPTLGLIYVLPGKNVTTDYPYKREIKDENELSWREKVNFSGMKILEIKNNAGEVQGYIRILGPVTVQSYDTATGIVLNLVVPPELGEFPIPSEPGGGGAAPTQR